MSDEEKAFMEAVRNIDPEKSKKSLRIAEKKVRMILRGTYQNNPDYLRQYQPEGNVMIVGIRNKPVMYSQLTKEEKKIYRDRETEKRKKNGKTGMWDYLDLI